MLGWPPWVPRGVQTLGKGAQGEKHIFIISRTSEQIPVKLGKDHPYRVKTQSSSYWACKPQGGLGWVGLGSLCKNVHMNFNVEIVLDVKLPIYFVFSHHFFFPKGNKTRKVCPDCSKEDQRQQP